MDKENKSIKDIVDSVKKKADELYNKPLPKTLIPKDKHGGINMLPILYLLIIIILLMPFIV